MFKLVLLNAMHSVWNIIAAFSGCTQKEGTSFLNSKFILKQHNVIHKSVKHFKNSQQTDYATDHGNSYADRETNSPSFYKENLHT
jgi:hypothetical protein